MSSEQIVKMHLDLVFVRFSQKDHLRRLLMNSYGFLEENDVLRVF